MEGSKQHDFHDEFFVFAHEQWREGIVRQGTTLIEKNNPKVDIDTRGELKKSSKTELTYPI